MTWPKDMAHFYDIGFLVVTKASKRQKNSDIILYVYICCIKYCTSSNLDITLGHTKILIKCQYIFQPYLAAAATSSLFCVTMFAVVCRGVLCATGHCQVTRHRMRQSLPGERRQNNSDKFLSFSWKVTQSMQCGLLNV